MIEEENIRFMEVVEKLKAEGFLSDYVELASLLGTNKAGISDIKQGRKKVSIDTLRRMKKSYPQINLTYIIMGVGLCFCEDIPQSDTIASISAGEESFMYKIYKEKDEENKALIAENSTLKERLRTLETVTSVVSTNKGPNNTGNSQKVTMLPVINLSKKEKV